MGFLEETFSWKKKKHFYEANFKNLNDLEHSIKNTFENRFYFETLLTFENKSLEITLKNAFGYIKLLT